MAYQIRCNITYAGAVLTSENTPERRTLKRAASPSFEACIADCNPVSFCVAVAYVQESCVLFSDITGLLSSPGAQAAVRAAYAAENAAILNNATTPSGPGPTLATQTEPFSVAISQYISQHDASDTPIPTSPDTIVYVTPPVVSPVSSSTPQPYSSLISDYISEHVSQDSPASTSPDNVVYVTYPSVSVTPSLSYLSASTSVAPSSLAPTSISNMWR